jgi:hypothetical protein
MQRTPSTKKIITECHKENQSKGHTCDTVRSGEGLFEIFKAKAGKGPVNLQHSSKLCN